MLDFLPDGIVLAVLLYLDAWDDVIHVLQTCRGLHRQWKDDDDNDKGLLLWLRAAYVSDMRNP